MITLTGEVRKVLEDSYKDKSGNQVSQKTLVIEPADARQNYQVSLTRKQCEKGAHVEWEKLIGKQACIAVFLYVNYDYKFYKYTAVGSGLPLTK